MPAPDGRLPPLTPDDARAILSHYALGDFVALRELPFRAHNAPYYEIRTTSGRYFLKRYRRFDLHVDRGLDLIEHLRRHGFPAVEVHLTTSGSPHASHAGAEVALFEFLDVPQDWSLTTGRAAALGTALGQFHTLADGFDLPETFLGHPEFGRRLRTRTLHLWPWLPPAARSTIEWVRENFPAFCAAPDQPRGACHVEFNPEHVRFEGDAVFRVFDWDIVGADFLFHDLGTTLSSAVHSEGIDFAALEAIARAYDSQRPLTTWERDRLYEATCFGTCKFLIWELEPDLDGPEDLPYDTLRKVDFLRTLGKAGFDEAL